MCVYDYVHVSVHVSVGVYAGRVGISMYHVRVYL